VEIIGYVNTEISARLTDSISWIRDEGQETSAKYIYNWGDLNKLGKQNIGRVYFDTSTKSWNKHLNLMLKPVLYNTVKFVYDNLIDNPIQGPHGCPFENGIEVNSPLINCQGISCLGSNNITWDTTNATYFGISYYGNKTLKYYNCFTNIPIISKVDSNEFSIITDNSITVNVPKLNSFFGITESINLYDINFLNTQNNINKIIWKSKFTETDNNIELYNYDRTNSTSKLASGFLFSSLEQVNDTTKKYTTNPYSIHQPSSHFSNALPLSSFIASNLIVSIGSYPRYHIIPYDSVITKDSFLSVIQINNSSSIRNELLSYTYKRINHYCDILSSIINTNWNINNNKPYSYKDLLGLSNNLSGLASAILQYENGNSCVNGDNPVSKDYIVTNDLGTLNAYNWINWEFIDSVTQENIYTADVPTIVNYLSGNTDNYKHNWIDGQYNIAELIPN